MSATAAGGFQMVPISRRDSEGGSSRHSIPIAFFSPSPSPPLSPQSRAIECNVCFETPRNTLLPCGHSVMCEKCTESTLQGSAMCPICRKVFATAWVSDELVGGETFIHIVDPQKMPSGYKILKRTAPVRTANTPLATVLSTNHRTSFGRREPCRQAACWYLFAFAVSIVFVFVGAITTNWHCEQRRCMCNQALNTTVLISQKAGVDEERESRIISANLTCALVCSCLDYSHDSLSSLNITWSDPSNHGNKVIATECSPETHNNQQLWTSLCPHVQTTSAYLQGTCLSLPESEVPCGGLTFNYYLFTIGWYTIILLTNLLFFLCLCYCLGMCRAGLSVN
eukprot:c5138_g1_i1.p1 GENE.c5138_g1_i1~~c5138_g1_i1.p1  ORF type:complete len:339 (-),score=59.72 c5138_g1_i1:183-1199(-)